MTINAVAWKNKYGIYETAVKWEEGWDFRGHTWDWDELMAFVGDIELIRLVPRKETS